MATETGTTDSVIFTVKVKDDELKAGAVRITNNFKKIGDAAEDTGKRVKDGLGGDAKKALKDCQDRADLLVKSIAAVGIAGFKVLSAAVVSVTGFLGDSVQAFADYETALSAARRTMGLTKEETDDLGASLQTLALDMSAMGLQGAVSSNELARIAGIAGQMGFSFTESSADLNTFTQAIAKTAIAFEMNAEKAAASIGILTNIFDIPIAKTEELAGAIAILGDNITGSANDVVNFATRFGPVFAEMGGTINQALALGATLRESGITMEVAGTAMTQLVTNMQTEYSKFEQVLAAGGLQQGMLEMKLRAGDAMGAIQLVATSLDSIAKVDKLAATQAMRDLGLQGFRSLTVLQSLVTQFPNFQKHLESISDPLKNVATLQEKYTAAIDNMNGRWTAFKNAVTIIKQVIGKELANAIEKTLQNSLNPFIARFAEWAQNSPNVYKLTKSLGEVIELLGSKLAKAGESLLAWLDGMGQMQSSTNIAMEFDKKLKNLAPTFELLKNKAILAFKGIKDSLENAWSWWVANGPKIVKVIENVTWAIGEMFALLEDSGKIFEDFADGFWNDVAKPLSALDKMSGDLGTAFEKIGRDANVAEEGLANIGKEAEKTADILYGNSLFPDWVMWAQKTGDGMVDLVAEVEELSSSVNLSAQEFGNMMAMTGLGIDDMKAKLEGFSDEQVKMLAENLGGGMLRMTESQLKSSLGVYETMKTMQDGLAQQSVSSLQQINKAMRDLILTNPGLWAVGNAKALTSASSANRSEQLSMADQFAAQKATGGAGDRFGGAPINALQAAFPATPAAPSTLQATVKIGDEEIGVIAAAINDSNYQSGRRAVGSWGNNSTSASTGGSSWGR